MNKAVFIDKDGTLIPDIPYNIDLELIELEENSIRGLKEIKRAGYLLIIISNQSGVARGYFAEKELERVKEKLTLLLTNQGIKLDGFYYCPHHPEGIIKEYIADCGCRKPKAGMIIKAAEDFEVDLSQSWMIGDILNDVEAGNTAGCRTILIDNGNETEWIMNKNRQASAIVKSINEAAELILEFAEIESKQDD